MMQSVKDMNVRTVITPKEVKTPTINPVVPSSAPIEKDTDKKVETITKYKYCIIPVLLAFVCGYVLRDGNKNR